MNLKTHYNRLWIESLQEYRDGNFQLDTQIDNKSDTRYGLTLLARPSLEIRNKISEVLRKIQPFAPYQYFYPVSDMHVTVLSIISCQPDFSLDKIDKYKYVKLIDAALAQINPIEITFRGLTASPSALMICGFPEKDKLDKVRIQLRKKFNQSSLYHTIDERYVLQTAHATVIRFRKQLSKSEAFIQKIKALKNYYLSTCTIYELELVGNDWYQRAKKVELVKEFSLKPYTKL